jgi:hypothetical protein
LSRSPLSLSEVSSSLKVCAKETRYLSVSLNHSRFLKISPMSQEPRVGRVEFREQLRV